MLQLGLLLEEKKAREEKEIEALKLRLRREPRRRLWTLSRWCGGNFQSARTSFSWDAKIKSFAKTTARQMTESSFPATPRPGKKIVVKMPGSKKVTRFTTVARPGRSSRWGWGVFVKAVWKDLPISYDVFTYEIGA